MLPKHSCGLDDAALIKGFSAEAKCQVFAEYCCCCCCAVEMDVRGAMTRGGLDWHLTLYCAAVRYGCSRGLRVGGYCDEHISPIHCVGSRPYANMYFAFGTGKPEQRQDRWRLTIPKFSRASTPGCSCCEYHPVLQQACPEAEAQFSRMRQQELKTAMKVYAIKQGLVDAAATISHIRQQAHAPGLSKGGPVAITVKAAACHEMPKTSVNSVLTSRPDHQQASSCDYIPYKLPCLIARSSMTAPAMPGVPAAAQARVGAAACQQAHSAPAASRQPSALSSLVTAIAAKAAASTCSKKRKAAASLKIPVQP